MTMHVQSYLFFDGRCEEAMQFYVKALGAEHKVLHACLRIGDANVMMSDGHCAGQPRFEGFSLSLALPDARRAEEMLAALSDGGQVQMPLQRTFWSPLFGM